MLINLPQTENEWKELAAGFNEKWNFPHCIGALDGKHIICKAPGKSGSSFYNYKGSFSVVLMALVDSKYRFTYCNIGAKGSVSDGGVFSGTTFYKKLKNAELNLPPSEPLPGRTVPTPYVIGADDAFPLEEHIMKPLPRRDLSGTQIGLFENCTVFIQLHELFSNSYNIF